jgi:hypothetical protein
MTDVGENPIQIDKNLRTPPRLSAAEPFTPPSHERERSGGGASGTARPPVSQTVYAATRRCNRRGRSPGKAEQGGRQGPFERATSAARQPYRNPGDAHGTACGGVARIRGKTTSTSTTRSGRCSSSQSRSAGPRRRWRVRRIVSPQRWRILFRRAGRGSWPSNAPCRTPVSRQRSPQ